MPPQAGPGPNVLVSMFPFLIMFVIFYMLVFRPQSQARKAHEQMLKDLKKYDEVVPSGGIFGTVMNVKTDAVTLRIDENVRVDVERSAITRLVSSKKGGETVVDVVEKRA